MKTATQNQQSLAQKDRKIAWLEKQNEILKEQLFQLTHRQFGTSSEKYDVDQRELLFDEAEASGEVDSVVEMAEDAIEVPAHIRKKHGRVKLDKALPRIDKVYDLSEDEKVCPHDGHKLHQMGEAVSEQLEIIPAKLQVIRHVRLKYACRHCEQVVKTATALKQPIPKSIASPGLLANIAVNKYQDALPLYRQQSILKRHGIALPRATLANWMIKSGELLIPLMNLMRDKLLEGKLIHMDETSVQVLKEPDKKAQSKSYMWVQCSGLHGEPIILYDYSPTRSGQVPIALLQGYQGLLQTDGYEGYAGVARQPGIIQLGCWAHARRKFDIALKASKTKTGKAQMAMSLIQKLYRVETLAKGQSAEQIKQLRQSQSLPVVKQLQKWMDKSIQQVPPQSLSGKALTYLKNQWPTLVQYLNDGHAAIDNNRAERCIRPFVIGRKNWLFSNSVRGAKASAAIYSVIETAKANQIEPLHYLTHLFKQLPNANTLEDFEALLPWNVDQALFK